MPFGLVSVEQWRNEFKGPPPKRRNASSVYTVREMEEATCSFSEENLLGKGGFGRVYKGTLKSGQVVAIKKMELPPFKAAEGEREFRVEVDILSRLDHPNLVNLIGYCADGKQRFLVYEYMHKGNFTKRCLCIWRRVTRAVDWKKSSGPEPRAKRSKLGAPGTGNHVLPSNIMGRSSYTMESVAMFANLASRCIRVDSQERPSMTECIKELQLILYINSKGLGMTMHALRMK